MYNDGPRIHVSIERKINVGNFESAAVSMGISGIPFDADEAEILQAMETQRLAYSILAGEMKKKIARIRREPMFAEEHSASITDLEPRDDIFAHRACADREAE
jgi:hypothetical protein